MIFVDEFRPLPHYDVTENEDLGSGCNKNGKKMRVLLVSIIIVARYQI